MDNSDRDHLRINLPDLLQHVVCTTSFLEFLRDKDVISKSEISYIDAQKYHGVFSQSMRLIEILQSRIGGYETLISALHVSNQLDALRIVLHDNHKKEHRDCLKICVQNGQYDQVTELIQSKRGPLSEIISVLIPHDKLLHLGVRNSRDDHPVTIDNKIKIIKLFQQIVSSTENPTVSNILEIRDSQGRTPLLQENVSMELLKYLINYAVKTYTQ